MLLCFLEDLKASPNQITELAHRLASLAGMAIVGAEELQRKRVQVLTGLRVPMESTRTIPQGKGEEPEGPGGGGKRGEEGKDRPKGKRRKTQEGKVEAKKEEGVKFAERLKDKYVRELLNLCKEAGEDAKHLQTAMATARPDAALLSLFGKRRKRTLRAMAQDLLRLKKSVGGKAELFQIEESDLMNVMFDQADKPCGKSFPEKLVRTVALVWERLGLPPTVTVASRGLAAALKVQLSEANLQAVRKALTPLIVTICAMELEVAEGQIEGQELLIMGTELIKVYTSSRWDDVRHLDAQGLKLTDTFWGGERGFLQTKMSGAGCQTEVLPAWVARKHSISGKDWLGALLKKCEDQKLPWGKGYLLVDLDTAEPMEYEKKMRLTREILSDLDHAPAARLLEYPGNWSGKRYLPKGVAATHTEHGARGWVAGMGLQLGLPKPRLVFAGRWVPKDSVEDYARESRAAVLRNVEDVTLAIRKG